jgi:hypothetical protein
MIDQRKGCINNEQCLSTYYSFKRCVTDGFDVSVKKIKISKLSFILENVLLIY